MTTIYNVVYNGEPVLYNYTRKMLAEYFDISKYQIKEHCENGFYYRPNYDGVYNFIRVK